MKYYWGVGLLAGWFDRWSADKQMSCKTSPVVAYRINQMNVLFWFTGCLLVAISQAAPPGAAPNVMALQDPDISMSLRAVKHNDPGLSAYLSDPKSVCTFFVPDNKVHTSCLRGCQAVASAVVALEQVHSLTITTADEACDLLK